MADDVRSARRAASQRAERSRPVHDPPPQAVMGLLNYLTATSLDEDYAHVSRRRTPSGPRRVRRPGLVALVVLAVFGALVATAAVQTSRNADVSASSRASLVTQANDGKDALSRSRAVIAVLQGQIATAEAGSLDTTTQGRAVQARLSRLGVVTGADVTHGPGITVRVDDAPGAGSFKQQVQAPDLQRIVNAIWQVGAEAVSINGQRLSALSAIRDAAGAITVNYVSLRRPYVISAVGDPKTMGARLLDTAGGQTWVTLQSSFGLKFDVNSKDSMVLPAASRVTLRTAHEPKAGR